MIIRAMAIHTALALPRERVSALVVIDVVEGTALEALPKMLSILRSRPQKFADLKSAISWACVEVPIINIYSHFAATRTAL